MAGDWADDRARDRARRAWSRYATALALALCLLVGGGRSVAGHSVGHYPSYYPDEIRIDAIDPAAAGKGLVEETLHAYVGASPHFEGPLPEHVKSAKSLGSFLILALDPASPRFASAEARCAVARGILASLGGQRSEGFIPHPYPVTPFHADYLHHLDLIEAAKTALGSASAQAFVPTQVAAKGALAETIVRAHWGQPSGGADMALEEVPAAELIGAVDVELVGWSWPPWAKEGWFHAHRLLASGLDAVARPAAKEIYDRLVHGRVRSLAERTDLERRLVAALNRGCARTVVGYTLREEFFNDIYPAGVENITYDSIAGLGSPVFVRTVKLKDYPWNGKLQLGVRQRATAAWNPVAGFTDPVGRLLLSAVGDPAMIQFPFNASWMPNRVQAEVVKVTGQSGGMKVPADAMAPQPGSGAFERVGDWTFASAKVTYEVLASPFEDGSEMGVADILYPYAFAYRWGAAQSRGGRAAEPRLEVMVASLQERLVGIKLLRVEKTTHAIAEGLTVVTQTPVLEVYLRDAPGDERQLAALAPPWSTVPWHLLALMEEAVARGLAAFSGEEAARLGLPWLDLVRDPALGAKLRTLIAELEREGYRPLPLAGLVTAEEARERWRALGAFAARSGHLLVTNGPYRLKSWTPDGVVLEAVREMTYPLGFGTFDRFVNPPRAVIEEVAQTADAVSVRAGAEMVLKMGRNYRLVKEPLSRTTMRGVHGLLVVSRYLLIDPDGKVAAVDKMHWGEDGRFSIALPPGLAPGRHTIVLGIFLDGNALDPPARIVHFDVGGGAAAARGERR